LARIDPKLLYPVKHRSAQAQADLMGRVHQRCPGAHQASPQSFAVALGQSAVPPMRTAAKSSK